MNGATESNPMKARWSRTKVLIFIVVLVAAGWGGTQLVMAWLQPHVITVVGTSKGSRQFPFKPGMTAADAYRLYGFMRETKDLDKITLTDASPMNRGKVWLKDYAEKKLKGTRFDPSRSYPKWLAPTPPKKVQLHDLLIPGCEIAFVFKWKPVMIARKG
jgi:hypothetical protein